MHVVLDTVEQGLFPDRERESVVYPHNLLSLRTEHTLAADKQQQADELAALESIFGDDCLISSDLTTCQVT